MAAAILAKRATRHAARRLRRLHPTRSRCAMAAAVVGALCLVEWTVGMHPAAPTHQEAAAIRHAARRLMFGGFIAPAGTRGRLSAWLAGHLFPRRRMQRLTAQALAEHALAGGPFAGAGLGAAPRRLGSAMAEGPGYHRWALPRRGVDPWLPRLGPVGSAAQALGLQSFYSKWIVADLSVWGESGISAVRSQVALCILLGVVRVSIH